MSDLISRFEEGMMWESPIKVMQKEVKMQMEGDILKAVQEVGIVVDKEELTKALKYDREQYERGYVDGFNANKWIPVEERLPERQDSQNSFLEMYLVQSKRGGIHMGFRDEEGIWRTIHGNRVYQDVAWQPLPEPYKGE